VTCELEQELSAHVGNEGGGVLRRDLLV